MNMATKCCKARRVYVVQAMASFSGLHDVTYHVVKRTRDGYRDIAKCVFRRHARILANALNKTE